jgi:hypothetical protein
LLSEATSLAKSQPSFTEWVSLCVCVCLAPPSDSQGYVRVSAGLSFIKERISPTVQQSLGYCTVSCSSPVPVSYTSHLPWEQGRIHLIQANGRRGDKARTCSLLISCSLVHLFNFIQAQTTAVCFPD